MTDLPHPRHRAVTEIDLLIAEAEQLQGRYRLDLRTLADAGGETRRTAVLLRLAEERLDQLRRSRDVLIGDDSGETSP